MFAMVVYAGEPGGAWFQNPANEMVLEAPLVVVGSKLKAVIEIGGRDILIPELSDTVQIIGTGIVGGD
jgi:hypothetical protein